MIMYGGLSYGGAHRQTIRLACALDPERFAINYFWCKPNPDLHSDFVWPELDYSNIELMRSHGINVIEFQTRTRDISHRYQRWIVEGLGGTWRGVQADYPHRARPLPATSA